HRDGHGHAPGEAAVFAQRRINPEAPRFGRRGAVIRRMRAFDAVFLHVAAADEAAVIVKKREVVPRCLQIDHRGHRDDTTEVADGF
ncbi:MAG: hypothetical protein ACK55I_16155, partial [bacterium]